MNPTELVKLFSEVKLRDWMWSRDGSDGLPVGHGACGVRNLGTVWVEFTWDDDTGPHLLHASRSVHGDTATVSLDGVEHRGLMPIRKHLKLAGISVEVDVRVAGLPAWRFDAMLSV